MPRLGLGTSLSAVGLPTASHVTSNLKMLHRYNTGSVVPVSDGSAFFDGAVDYIDISETTLSVHDNPFSFAFWVKIHSIDSSAGWHPIIGDDDNFHNLITIDKEADRILIEGNTDNDYIEWATAQDPLVIGAWNHFAICLDGSGSGTCYQNGAELSKISDTIGSDVVFRYIGRAQTKYAHINLCNLAYWSANLTQAQVKSIMWKNYAGLTDSEKTNLVSWWNLSADANDSHGSNNGTLSG